MGFLPVGDTGLDQIVESGFLTVWEGAVRSAKTVKFLLAFMDYVINSTEKVFLLTGATQGTVSRNCIRGEFGFVALSGDIAIPRTDADGSKYLDWLGNTIYYMGADNTRSFTKVQGLTIGGWAADEVNLHDPEFIAAALNRSIAAADGQRRNFWTLNPDVPNHFIYTDYIDKYLAEKLPGFRWFHCTLDDNPALSEDRKAELRAQYTGVFYKRYILGLRVRAEGAIYVSFKNNSKGEEGNVIEEIPEDWKIQFVEIGVDIGGNKSATCFNAVGYYRNKKNRLCVVILDEFYDSENLSVEAVLRNFRAFVDRVRARGYTIAEAYVDSAEQLIIKSMREMNIVNIGNSKKIPIIDRIRLFDVLFSTGRAHILRSCSNTVEAFETAVWAKTPGKDERLDNGTTKIDPLDASEYAVERRLNELIA